MITRSALHITLAIAFFGWFLGMLVAGHVMPELLEHRRILMLRGEWWRPFTGSFTHANDTHLLHNVCTAAVLLMMFKLFAKQSATRLIGIHSIMYCTFCLILILDAETAYYRGLSGSLHGMWLILGAALYVDKENKSLGLIIATVVMLKVAIEQTTNSPIAALWGTEPTYHVATASHLFGLITGSLACVIAIPWLKVSKAS